MKTREKQDIVHRKKEESLTFAKKVIGKDKYTWRPSIDETGLVKTTRSAGIALSGPALMILLYELTPLDGFLADKPQSALFMSGILSWFINTLRKLFTKLHINIDEIVTTPPD